MLHFKMSHFALPGDLKSLIQEIFILQNTPISYNKFLWNGLFTYE
jgi:hypothetical protein